MKKNLFLFFVLIYSVGFLFSQASGELKGTLTDETGVPVDNAVVEVLLDNIPVDGGYTEENGSFWIRGISTGTYQVRFRQIGFDTLVVDNVVISTGELTILNKSIFQIGYTGGGFTKGGEGKMEIPLGKDPTHIIIARDVLYQIPVLRPNDMILLTPGVHSRYGNFMGSRQASTIFINGVKVRNGMAVIPRGGVESINIYPSGIPVRFGDVVGGVVEITMRNIPNVFFGSVEARTSQLLDDYGHYYFSGSFGGPLIKRREKKDETGKSNVSLGKPILGVVVSFEGGYDKDPNPGFGGWYRASDEALNRIVNDPLRMASPGQSGTRLNAEFLDAGDFTKTNSRMNAAAQYFNLNAKFDIAPGKNTFISIGGYLNAAQTMIWDRNNSIFNWENNGRNQSITGSVFGRFVQYFKNKPDAKKNSAKNGMLTLQVDYLKGFSKTEDVRHQNNFFNYGHVGKFDILQRPTYSYGYDPILNTSGYLFTGYQDTMVLFTPGTVNPQTAAITSQVYSLYPNSSMHYNQLTSLMNSGGIINGYSPRTVYDLYNAPGTAFNAYQLADNNQFRINLSSSFTVGNHDISFGFEFEQRTDAHYEITPVGLWTSARLLTNSHLGTLDVNNPEAVYNNGVYQDTINYNTLYVADPNRPGFGLGQTFFDYSLRKKLGLDPNSLTRINVDALDPSTLDITMFSADELFNNGNTFIRYAGYDVYGNRTDANVSLEDFFTAKDQYGNLTRPIGAFTPNYMGGYIQDRFSFKDIVFNVGLRVDRYDANQQVLKDPYSLYDTRKAGDVTELAGSSVSHPGNVGENWVVYVNDQNNPTSILGYRDGNTWYNAEGNVINDPTVLRNSSGRVQPFLADANSSVSKPGPGLFNAFTDYVPQINVMPRISFYFPISDKSMFAATYDVLSQRPTIFNGNRNLSQSNPMDYLFWDNTSYNSASTVFNNPNLRPERTTEFSLSFVQIISDVIQVKLRAYYKEMRDMIATVKVQEAYPRTYTSWSNIDFATSKGFSVEVLLKPHGNNLNLNASYALQFADGTGSSSFSQLNLINSGSPNLRSTIPLAFDSRHQFKLYGSFSFGDNKNIPLGSNENYLGPKGKFFESVFRNLSVGISMVGNSGTPYSRQVLPTPTQLMTGGAGGSLEGSLNGARLPFEFYGDLNFTKDINFMIKNKKGVRRTSMQIYLNIQNVFNVQNIVGVYGATGSANDDGYLTSPNYTSQITSQVSSSSYINYYTMKMNDPYNFSAPRRIKLGVIFDF